MSNYLEQLMNELRPRTWVYSASPRPHWIWGDKRRDHAMVQIQNDGQWRAFRFPGSGRIDVCGLFEDAESAKAKMEETAK